MSDPVEFEHFCVRYELDSRTEDAKQQYNTYCQNLDIFNDVVEKSNWGGARAGAGRKTKYACTKVKRVPENYIPVIDALIEYLDDHAELNGKYHKDVESEPTFFRSLNLNAQEISFKIKPL